VTREEPAVAFNRGEQRSDEEAFEDGTRALKEVIEARPEAARELLEIIGRRIAGPIDENTWGRIETSLLDYLGDEDATGVLGWGLASDPGDTNRIEQLEQSGGPEVGELMRRIRGAYGLELRDAGAMRDFPDNWRTLGHRVYQAVALGTSFIELTIEKQNGDRFVLDGPADSTLSLAHFITGALRVAGRDAFSDELVEEFSVEAEELLKQWRATAEAGTQADSGTVAPGEL
jgi:hypothetical protein